MLGLGSILKTLNLWNRRTPYGTRSACAIMLSHPGIEKDVIKVHIELSHIKATPLSWDPGILHFNIQKHTNAYDISSGKSPPRMYQQISGGGGGGRE